MATISASPWTVVPGRRPGATRRRTQTWPGESGAGAAGTGHYRRRAAALLLAVSAALASLLTVRAAVPSASVSPSVTARAESAAHPAWTVQPGDTLWAIAGAATPQADPRATVLVLRDLNDLGADRVLQPGQVILLPRR